MLVLTRESRQRVRLRISGVVVWVTVLENQRGKVRLGFDAPPSVEILREELVEEGERGTDAK